jgi:hypothetical protein
MYNAAEMGAGMKAFGMSSGKFAKGVNPSQGAVQMGNIFGLSAEESLGQAGTFQRTGADFEKTLYQGAGAGMETELPKLMSAMASTLEEAVKNGVNTSDLSDDLGADLIALTMATTTKSVAAAQKVAASAGVSKGRTEKGQVQNIEDMFLWKGGQEKMLETLNDPKEREKKLSYMMERGMLTPDQKTALEQDPDITLADLRKTGGEELLNRATQDQISSMSKEESAIAIGKSYKKGGMSMNQAIMISQSTGGMGEDISTAWLAGEKDFSQAGIKGKKKVEGWDEGVMKSDAASGVKFARTKENDLLDYGKEFANATIEMDKAMRTLAKEGMGMATEGIKTMGDMAMQAADSMKEMAAEFKKIKDQGFGKYIKSMLWD